MLDGVAVGERGGKSAGAPTDQAAEKPKPVSASSERRLFIDATGTLLALGSAPTGIPRVEDFLVRAAIAENDPAVMVVKLDRRERTYKSLDLFETRQLRNQAAVDQVDIQGGSPAKTLRQAFKVIRQYPTIGRDVDRHFADIATNSRRRGFQYQLLKVLIRTYRWFYWCLAQIAIARSRSKSTPVDVAGGTVLLSNTVVLSSSLARILQSAKAPAFICHDLIPFLYPSFAIGTDHAKRFISNIHQILRTKGATALCTSQTSLAMLCEYTRSASVEAARIERFPLPSVLLEKAGYVHGEAVLPDEPFILFCATVEVRKNHLLLAKVWKQAIDEGVTLPKLLCVGKWGWGVDELSSYLATHRGLSERIVFTGPLGDAQLIGCYKAAMFGVQPSRVEGWGYGASECLDFGLPAIVSTAPALREATCGLMPAIDPDDQAGWYAEIRSLSESAERRAWYRRQIAERYRPTSTATSWARVKSALLHD